MPANPFTPLAEAYAAAGPANAEAAAFAGVVNSAAALWDGFAELPGKAEATLAQRRLQEAMFWAGQSIMTFVREG